MARFSLLLYEVSSSESSCSNSSSISSSRLLGDRGDLAAAAAVVVTTVGAARGDLTTARFARGDRKADAGGVCERGDVSIAMLRR